jgi:hypothetical protein
MAVNFAEGIVLRSAIRNLYVILPFTFYFSLSDSRIGKCMPGKPEFLRAMLIYELSVGGLTIL